MKIRRNYIVSSLVLSLVGLSSTPAIAATAGTKQTEGIVTFQAPGGNTGGPIIKPGTDEEVIVPDGGKSTTGPLRIEWVPDLNFGQIEVASIQKYKNVEWSTYSDDSGPANNKIPQFAQVTDERGTNGQWKLLVEQTDAFAPVGNLENPDLAGTVIEILEQKNYITYQDSESEIQTKLAGLATTPSVSTPVRIPFSQSATSVNGTGPIVIMHTKADQTTDGTKASTVFNNVYGPNDSITEADNSGMRLNVPGSDQKKAAEIYNAKLKWTLEDSI